MKFVILLAFTTFVLSSTANTIIKGEVTNFSEYMIYYTEPVDGFSNVDIEKPIAVSNTGSSAFFEISIANASTVFIKIKIGGLPVWLLIEPNDSLSINIDMQKFATSIEGLQIIGNNAAGHLLYNKINIVPFLNYAEIHELLEKPIINDKNFIQSIKTICELKLEPFRKLLSQNNISKTFFSTLYPNLKAMQLGECIKFLKRSSKGKNEKVVIDIMDKVFMLQYPFDSMLNKGTLSVFYQTDYCDYNYRLIKKLKLNQPINDSLVAGEKSATYLVNRLFVPYLHVNDKVLREHLIGRMLVKYIQFSQENTFRDVSDFFQNEYPDNAYSIAIQKLDDVYAKGKGENFVDKSTLKVTIIDTMNRINVLGDITKFVSGNFFYIDIWASWCIPCREEFFASKKSDSLFSNLNIQKVFISMDDSSAKQSWQYVIRRYNLSGYHILAGKRLKKYLLKTIYKSDSKYTVPHYVILDSKGRIVISNAFRPSESEQLHKQFLELQKVSANLTSKQNNSTK